MDVAVGQLTADEGPLPLQKIGQGFCGTVWASLCRSVYDEPRVVIKREDGGPGRSILLEYLIHLHLLAMVDAERRDGARARPGVNIPFCEGLLGKDSTDWPRILPRLPPSFEPCNALVNERIPPMPDRVCELLYRTYHPEGSLAVAPTEQNCLVRPYIGRRRYNAQLTAERTRPGRLLVFSLRNYPLHIDQMEELGLPAAEYAVTMADALAFLHWTAKLDGNDVEFVLAPARPATTATSSRRREDVDEFQSESFGVHTMWLLDFDCCGRMTMDEDGVKRAARSFLRNDPFYPKPGGTNDADVRLWRTFRERFMETSEWILQGKGEQLRRLPAMLIDEITRSSYRDDERGDPAQTLT